MINTDRGLSDTEIRHLLADALGRLDLAGRRVLVVIPDGTRTAPIGLFFALLGDVLGKKVEALDYLIALGTHPAMDDAAKSRLLETAVVDGMAGTSRIFNHRWEIPETFSTLGTIPAAEVAETTDGRLEIDIEVRLNQLVGDSDGNATYDHILVCGPVFPHEVAGFSGGNKYFVPGVAGQEVIDATHWVGALVTSHAIIGVRETPVRRLIERAASLIPTPRSLIALVMHGHTLHGVFVGGMEEAWREATELSADLDIVWVDRHVQARAGDRRRWRGRDLRAAHQRGLLCPRTLSRPDRLSRARLFYRAVASLRTHPVGDSGALHSSARRGHLRRRGRRTENPGHPRNRHPARKM
jgi:nickel-dependent lactate racemase